MKSLEARSFPQSFSGVVMGLLLLSCNGGSPTAPPAQPPPPASSRPGAVWGYVFTGSSDCLRGAVVEVLDGARAGAKSTQIECDFDSGVGYEFRDLPADTYVRMRASKEGYQSQERTFYATSGPAFESNFMLPPE